MRRQRFVSLKETRNRFFDHCFNLTDSMTNLFRASLLKIEGRSFYLWRKEGFDHYRIFLKNCLVFVRLFYVCEFCWSMLIGKRRIKGDGWATSLDVGQALIW